MIKNKKGIILPCVLWTLLILTVLFSTFHNRLKNNIILIRELTKLNNNNITIKNAISVGMALLYNANSNIDSFQRYHIHLDNTLNQSEDFSIKYQLEQGNEKIFYNGLYPLNSKININYIPLKIKNILIQNSNFSEEQFASLFDWIDSDNDPNNNGKGAENDFYENNDVPYKSKNNIIKTWSELYLIKDMDEDFFNYLKENFTIYDNGKININTVTLETLKLLGYGDSLSEKLFEYLSGADGIRGTNDDIVIDDLSTFPTLLSKEYSFTAYEVSEIVKHIDLFTVTSDSYKINIYINDIKIAEAIITRDQEKTLTLENVMYI